MSDDLYFVELIRAALEQPEPQAALRAAFARIEALGRQLPRYRRGYEQFLRLAEAVRTAQLQAAPEELAAAILQAVEPPGIEIRLIRAGRAAAVFAFDRAEGVRHAGPIAPGPYQLKLDTGQVLWEGRLSEQELIWAKAFPGRPLEMAADSHPRTGRPTKELLLQEGSVRVRVYAGVEAGGMEVELIKPEARR